MSGSEHEKMDQYAWNEQCAAESIASKKEAIPENIRNGDVSRAVFNYGGMAQLYVDLGLLHWRRGLDPRPDFENVLVAYKEMRDLAYQHRKPETVSGSITLVYAALFLMGRTSAIEFGIHDHELARWPCYECCLVHLLHDQPLDETHSMLLEKHLTSSNELVDQSFLTYFQLLGFRPSDKSRAELVLAAERHWLARKGTRFFEDAASPHGYGVMNELYVDLFLAAVLKKVGWEGESVHRWRWE